MRIAAHTLNVPVAPMLSIRIGSKNVPSAAPIRLKAITIPTPVPRTLSSNNSGGYGHSITTAMDIINANAANATTVIMMEMFCPTSITIRAIAAPKNVDVRKRRLEILPHNQVPTKAPAIQNTSYIMLDVFASPMLSCPIRIGKKIPTPK